MARYVVRLRQDVERWVSNGLIDTGTAGKLLADAESRDRQGFGSGAVLAMMAALLLGAAILIFVAANWEAFPRLLRVGALFSVIAGGYVGGAIFKSRGHGAIGEALWIVAVAAFGGSLALIGQMYHISGDESAAMLTWCAATALAAVVLRSGPLTVVAVGIIDAWLAGLLTGGLFSFSHVATPHLFLPVAAVLFAISYLILLSVIAYASWLVVEGNIVENGFVMACVSAGLFAVAHVAPREVDNIVRLGGRLPVHALIGFLVAMALLQIELEGEGTFAVAAAVTLAGIVAAIVLQGRTSRGLRWIAYLAFALELCLIYGVTMGTMLGTAGFFLFAAVLLGLLAVIILRLEKRMGQTRTDEGRA
jgi:uncharacterized membrane protein